MIPFIFHPMYLASKAAGNSFHTCGFYDSVLTPELFQLLGEIANSSKYFWLNIGDMRLSSYQLSMLPQKENDLSTHNLD